MSDGLVVIYELVQALLGNHKVRIDNPVTVHRPSFVPLLHVSGASARETASPEWWKFYVIWPESSLKFE